MRITRLSWQQFDLKLKEPYTIAYETISEAPQIVLRIDTDTGLTGWGCASPDLPVTGERPDDVVSALESVIGPGLEGRDVFTFALLLSELKAALPGRSSTMNMVDMALRDLVARKAGVPLYQLLGGFRKQIETSITVGILPYDETLERVRSFVSDGFRIIKLKGGSNVEEDIDKVIRLREAIGGSIRIRFDCNQGYSPEEAIRFFHDSKLAGIELLEQPTTIDQENQLGEVTDSVHIPVMADESMRSLKDVFRLASNELIDMVNIKLMKVGGMSEAIHINSVAKSAGIEAMVGCFDECALGISAGLHFALGHANVEFADLDGHLDLVDDPFPGLFTIRNGVLTPSDSPGLGPVDL